MQELSKDVNGLYILDDRTKNYFDAITNNLGYIGTNAGWDDIEEILQKQNVINSSNLACIKTYDGYLNSSNIDIYKYAVNGNIRYCAELSYQTDIDDYCIETHIFSKCPQRKDIFTVRDISDIQFQMEIGKLSPIFKCWECGIEIHWLDRAGDLNTKYDGLKEHYCGC